jgi:hypothetical protein
MSLRYVQEHNQEPNTKLNLPQTQLKLKHGELFRGKNATGIILRPNHAFRNVLIFGVIALVSVFAAKRAYAAFSVSEK